MLVTPKFVFPALTVPLNCKIPYPTAYVSLPGYLILLLNHTVDSSPELSLPRNNFLTQTHRPNAMLSSLTPLFFSHPACHPSVKPPGIFQIWALLTPSYWPQLPRSPPCQSSAPGRNSASSVFLSQLEHFPALLASFCTTHGSRTRACASAP